MGGTLLAQQGGARHGTATRAGHRHHTMARKQILTWTGWRMSIHRTSSWRHLPSSCEMSVSARHALQGRVDARRQDEDE